MEHAEETLRPQTTKELGTFKEPETTTEGRRREDEDDEDEKEEEELKDLMLLMMDGLDDATKKQKLQWDVFREQMAQLAKSGEGPG